MAWRDLAVAVRLESLGYYVDRNRCSHCGCLLTVLCWVVSCAAGHPLGVESAWYCWGCTRLLYHAPA